MAIIGNIPYFQTQTHFFPFFLALRHPPAWQMSPLQDQMDALLVAEPTAEANEAQLGVLATVFTTGIVVEP